MARIKEPYRAGFRHNLRAKLHVRVYMSLPQGLAGILQQQTSDGNSCVKVQQRPNSDQDCSEGDGLLPSPPFWVAAGGPICPDKVSSWTTRPLWLLKMNGGGRQEPFPLASGIPWYQSEPDTTYCTVKEELPSGTCSCNMAARPC